MCQKSKNYSISQKIKKSEMAGQRYPTMPKIIHFVV